jgi:hypothetical protein
MMGCGDLEGGIVSGLRNWVEAVGEDDMTTMGWQGAIDRPRSRWGYENQLTMKKSDSKNYSGFRLDKVCPNKLNGLITRGLSPLPVLRWNENRYRLLAPISADTFSRRCYPQKRNLYRRMYEMFVLSVGLCH